MNRSKSSSQGDDSLQYLTAEEKACLMFLEETIESLDTTEHSDLSHDESATANLTKGKAELRYSDDPRNSASKDRKRNYLVPTPFILANGNTCIPAKPGTASSSGKPPPRMDRASKSDKLPQNNPAVPEEVNVPEIPPRPLSSEHLVELRKNLSMRASVEFEKQPSTLESSVSENEGETQNTSESKPSRPAVAPKPKKIPSHIAGLSQKGTSSPHADSCLSTSPGNRSSFLGPTKVRQDALPKLGLVKEKPDQTKDEHSDWHKSDSASQNTAADRDMTGRTLSEVKRQSGQPSSAPRVLQKQPVASDFSVLKDQNMDEDRREALRKLGLLKN